MPSCQILDERFVVDVHPGVDLFLSHDFRKDVFHLTLNDSSQWICLLCLRRLNGPVQWRDHVVGKYHRRHLRELDAQIERQ